MNAPLMEVRNLVKKYRLPRDRLFAPPRWLRAVDDVSFKITAGRSFGIVGESGAGKSTLARAALALEKPTSGAVSLLGHDLFNQTPSRLRELRGSMQMIFQDPFSSLDPRHSIGRSVAEPLAALSGATRSEYRERVGEALLAVGLDASAAGKYPHEFSGGQRQRVAIARALITRPKLVIADEPVSALDVSVQANVLNLMNDLAESSGVTYLLISHDLSVIAHLCDFIAVMYSGRFVETGPAATVLHSPAHPYTRALIDAAPSFERVASPSPFLLPAAFDAPSQPGCAYASRCPLAQPTCREASPALAPTSAERNVACYFPMSAQ